MKIDPKFVALAKKHGFWNEQEAEPPGRKRVVIEVSFELLTDVPLDWDAGRVDFWLNESTHCLASEVVQLAEEKAHGDEGTCFSCHRGKGRYLRDATLQDLEKLTP